MSGGARRPPHTMGSFTRRCRRSSKMARRSDRWPRHHLCIPDFPLLIASCIASTAPRYGTPSPDRAPPRVGLAPHVPRATARAPRPGPNRSSRALRHSGVASTTSSPWRRLDRPEIAARGALPCLLSLSEFDSRHAHPLGASTLRAQHTAPNR